MGTNEHANEASGSIKGGEFRDCLSDYQLLKKDFAPCSYLIFEIAVNSVQIHMLR
jgi:hypothetical protein